MTDEASAKLSSVFLSVVFFPLFFQDTFLRFAWGATDEFWMMVLKRTFVLLPVLGFLVGCWISIACLLTIIVRYKRQDFLVAIFITWWDFFKSVFSLWGGVFKFLMNLIIVTVGFFKLIFFGILVLIQDILIVPFRIIKNIGDNVLSPGIPWIAVGLTIFWCFIEAGLFTYVTSPLIVDVLSNLTGGQLTDAAIRIPLFVFMILVVMGSYAVLSSWTVALKTKNIPTIVKISMIEFVVMMVEVVFLYREFVDALVPWFAQHSGGNFELGIFGILSISMGAWFGIRSISWFLFAAHGTPPILAVIQRSGLQHLGGGHGGKSSAPIFAFVSDFIAHIKNDLAWVKNAGDEILGSFILPPLQIVAASINFLSLLITSQHMFEIPFKSFREIVNSKIQLRSVSSSSRKKESN